VPERCGIAFVIIQHLDPTHKGIMPEILQRTTGMKVRQVTDRMPVEPDCVYVIPPNKDMSILHGVLHLFEPAAPRGLRLPIDFFFRALADDRQQSAIGVILSGMGTDGTLGLREIHEKGGLVVVQDPVSAKYDSMPRSAIDAGLADIVARAEELPGRIDAYVRKVPRFGGSQPGRIEKERSAGKDRHSIAGQNRPRFYPLQEKYPVSPHRAAHGDSPAGPDCQLCSLSAGESR
jgi:two-component system CheB/CheR fusion protein